MASFSKGIPFSGIALDEKIAVIAKIRYPDGRDSDPLFIGSRNRVNMERNEYDRLLIGVNDDNYRDNAGSYRVTIRW